MNPLHYAAQRTLWALQDTGAALNADEDTILRMLIGRAEYLKAHNPAWYAAVRRNHFKIDTYMFHWGQTFIHRKGITLYDVPRYDPVTIEL